MKVLVRTPSGLHIAVEVTTLRELDDLVKRERERGSHVDLKTAGDAFELIVSEEHPSPP
jgi:hypothetical protein